MFLLFIITKINKWYEINKKLILTVILQEGGSGAFINEKPTIVDLSLPAGFQVPSNRGQIVDFNPDSDHPVTSKDTDNGKSKL